MKKYLITTSTGIEHLIFEDNYISFIKNTDVIDIQEIIQTKHIEIKNQDNTEMIEFFSKALDIPIINNSLVMENGDSWTFENSEKWVSFTITNDKNIIKDRITLDMEICKKTLSPLVDYDIIEREIFEKLVKELENN